MDFSLDEREMQIFLEQRRLRSIRGNGQKVCAASVPCTCLQITHLRRFIRRFAKATVDSVRVSFGDLSAIPQAASVCANVDRFCCILFAFAVCGNYDGDEETSVVAFDRLVFTVLASRGHFVTDKSLADRVLRHCASTRARYTLVYITLWSLRNAQASPRGQRRLYLVS